MRSLTIIRNETVNDVKILTVEKEEKEDYDSYPEIITLQGVCYQKTAAHQGEVYYCV